MTRLGMLIDLKRCAGCYACVVACQLENNQKPGISWNKIDICEWGEEVGSSGRAYIPHACMHCSEPPCVDVCPTGASVQLEDGVVTVDYEACINCGSCYDVCPYEARIPNKVRVNYFNAKEPAPYEAYGKQRSAVVEKCDFCHSRVEKGNKPACVLNCPGGARYFGDLNDPDSDVSKRIAWGDAVRVDDTSFYYVPFSTMPAEAIPSKAYFAARSEQKEASSSATAVAAGVGAVAVAAAAAGIGIGVKKAKESIPAEVKNND